MLPRCVEDPRYGARERISRGKGIGKPRDMTSPDRRRRARFNCAFNRASRPEKARANGCAGARVRDIRSPGGPFVCARSETFLERLRDSSRSLCALSAPAQAGAPSKPDTQGRLELALLLEPVFARCFAPKTRANRCQVPDLGPTRTPDSRTTSDAWRITSGICPIAPRFSELQGSLRNIISDSENGHVGPPRVFLISRKSVQHR